MGGWAGLLALQGLGADLEVDELIAKLNADSYQERTAARREIVERLQDPTAPGLSELLAARYSDAPEVREQADLALREIFARQVLGAGVRECGVEWAYWLDRKDGRTLAYPMVRVIKAGSFLAKAGLREGDVVAACGGKTYDRRGSIVELMAALARAEVGKPLGMTVLRGSPGKPEKDRVESLQIKVIPVDSGLSQGRKEKPGEMDAWLKSLGKSGRVPDGKGR